MEVELDRALLTARPRDDLVLLAICAFGHLGRHRIVPDDRAAWDRWAETLPPDLEEEVRLAWDESERRASGGGRSERLAVVPVEPAQFRQNPIVLTPIEALALLGRPLRVLLENGRYDRAFVLAFADEATRRALCEAERDGWVVFETAGGITELVERVKAAQDSAPREVFRTMYLCDSDALEPGVPSGVAANVKQGLTALAKTFQRQASHFGSVLSRRAAENYAPPEAVLCWARDGFGPDAWRLIQQARIPAERAKLARSLKVQRVSRRPHGNRSRAGTSRPRSARRQTGSSALPTSCLCYARRSSATPVPNRSFAATWWIRRRTTPSFVAS